ncbi:hypothetical protein [Leisingera methylohalidivorans]|uniref:Endodeoxyribonuclease RusA n=1 Tax=Leisingera methylohalidivorans DSM 14336 TaxID=999552 RepID=V9VT06_9RHOB|nr:hypothetical protein [Leisingera methylohalidivorans]AHD00465.1 endodeoxyribonuclease RusA [Leisingera methylohalidivorans DSM 14336]
MGKVIKFPWPPKGLQPHAKGHWRPKAAATKAYRLTSAWHAQLARLQPDPGVVLDFTFCPPNRLRRDLQNMPGQMKPLIDGIADAMGVDDHGFRCLWPVEFGPVEKGGAVYVEIRGDAQ